MLAGMRRLMFCWPFFELSVIRTSRVLMKQGIGEDGMAGHEVRSFSQDGIEYRSISDDSIKRM